MKVTMKVVLGVLSTILFVIAACLLAATIFLGWLHRTQTSPDGFVTGPVVEMSTDGYAITSTDLDLGSFPDEWLPSAVVGTFQVGARSAGDSSLFLGVGPSSEVDQFLADVSHAEVTRFGSQSSLSYDEHAGSARPNPPSEVDFWVVNAEGPGQQTLDWEPEQGDWTLVVMNTDAAAGLDVSASIGAKTPWLPVGIWVTGMLAVLIAIGAVVIAVIASRQTTTADASDAGTPKPALHG
ncbi:MAG TPA: hypothetical protein VFS66_12820 [Acidimicrobiia bacterium]|nr:hypothetical protein [Acidimicrobiia bacterium]